VRTGLLKTIQFPGDLENRFQSNVRDAVEALAADHDLLTVPIAKLAVGGAIAAGKSVVFYGGKPGAILTLPAASAQGPSVAAIVLVGNASTGSVSLQATGLDTVNGGKSMSQAAGTVLLLTSDGISKWLAIVGASATATSITYGVFTATVAGLVPAPGGGAGQLFLRSDGTWADPTDDVLRKLRLLLAAEFRQWGMLVPQLEDDTMRGLST
jgi:hypothetical protein